MTWLEKPLADRIARALAVGLIAALAALFAVDAAILRVVLGPQVVHKLCESSSSNPPSSTRQTPTQSSP